jgi:hypothetical protein
MRHARLGGVALIVFAVASVSWFVLESTPPRLGFADTDNPSVSLAFLRDHGTVYAYAGLALFVMAGSLLIGSSILGDHLHGIGRTLAARLTSGTALIAMVGFFGHGVLRNSVGPLLHIDGIDPEWGQSAYLAVQMAGIHGFAQGGIVALSTWVILVAVIGRGTFIPWWLAALAVLAAFRLVTSLLGPLGVLEGLADMLWIASMAAILGSMLWPLAFGITLLSRRASAPYDSQLGLRQDR